MITTQSRCFGSNFAQDTELRPPLHRSNRSFVLSHCPSLISLPPRPSQADMHVVHVARPPHCVFSGVCDTNEGWQKDKVHRPVCRGCDPIAEGGGYSDLPCGLWCATLYVIRIACLQNSQPLLLPPPLPPQGEEIRKAEEEAEKQKKEEKARERKAAK